jgi:hypothetical protein
MMNEPVNIQRYAKLVVGKELPNETVSAWFKAAKDMLPNGIMTTCQTTDDTGRRSASMVCRQTTDGFEYIIPLTRDMTDVEIEPMVEHFTKKNPDVDFDIEVSSAQANNAMDLPSIEIKDHSFTELCTAWAKKQHDDWFKERTDGGWRYGLTVSISNKTHPLLRQWHELPDKYKTVDYDQPQGLLDLLNDQGYTVISKSELESIMNLLRKG